MSETSGAIAVGRLEAESLLQGGPRGNARLTGPLRTSMYTLMTRGQNTGKFTGQIEGSPSFWGDISAQRIRYCRNLTYTDINTLAVCPQMPYRDPARPMIPFWYCSADGHNCEAFLKVVSEANQDRTI